MAPPGPCRASCASRLSPHRLLWGAQHCATRNASLALRSVQLGRTAASTCRVRCCSFPPPLSAWPSCLPHGRSYPPAPKHTCPEVSSTLQTPVTMDTASSPHLQLKTARPACQARSHHAPSPGVWVTNCSTPRSPNSPSRLASTSSQLSPACPTSRSPPGHGTWRALHLLALASGTWVLPLAQQAEPAGQPDGVTHHLTANGIDYQLLGRVAGHRHSVSLLPHLAP